MKVVGATSGGGTPQDRAREIVDAAHFLDTACGRFMVLRNHKGEKVIDRQETICKYC